MKGWCAAWLIFGAASAATAALAGVPAAAKPLPAATSHAITHIRVVADGDYPPFLFVDAEGKPQGYVADAWQLFQQHTGIRVELVPMSWSQAQQQLQAGQADVIDMMHQTPARLAHYDFSPPYATIKTNIYVDSRIRGIRDVDTLRGFPVAVERGDACVERLQALGITDLHVYDDYRQIIEAASKGEQRVFCMDDNPANYYLYQYQVLDRFNPAFTLFDSEERRAVRKGNTAVLAAVERGMAQITPQERATLHQRWLANTWILRPYEHTLRIALAGVLVLLLAMLLLGLWTWLLRRNVALRTHELLVERDKLRALFDASLDAISVKDRDGIYLDCNEGMTRLFGLPRERFIGHRANEVLDAGESAPFIAADERALRTGEAQTAQAAFTLPGRGLRQLEITKVALRAPDGSVTGVLSTNRDITDRLAADAQLRLWAHAFETSLLAIVVFEVRTQSIAAANPAFARRRGYAPAEMLGMPADVLYPEEARAARREGRRWIDTQDHAVVEVVQVTRDGQRFPVQLDCSVSRDAEGQPQYVVVYAEDLSERKQAESELRLAEIAFQTQEAMLVCDPSGTIRRANHAMCGLTGYATDELLGQPVTLLTSTRHNRLSNEQLIEKVNAEGVWQGERWIRVKGGQPRVVRETISAVHGEDGAISHYVAGFVDLTSEREAHASVDRMTYFDPLTDLPNRHYLQGRLQHLLDKHEAGGALLMVDLDHFKRINELRGHAVGDRLLKLVAQRIRQLQQEDWGWLLARFSGGTFVVLLECGAQDGVSCGARARAGAERIQHLLHEPFELGEGMAISLTASIGWTDLTTGQDSPEAVLKEAELAMYSAKAAGRDQARWFEPSMHSELARNEALAQELRQAVAARQLEVYWQAQVDGRERLVGAEALLRWRRASGEMVSPGLFIPIAEETGLILPLGDWVLRQACDQLAAWAGQPGRDQLVLAVNVSARQFVQPGFVDDVRDALEDSGCDPARLKLEITESMVLGDLEEAAFRLKQLRDIGLRISLDDFGTGYSSLSYLSRLPLDQLKIDLSFVRRLPDDANDAMVAKTIIGMGHGLGLEVIAEGVETPAQRDFLLASGCDALQGYLYAKPLPLAELESLLARSFGQPVAAGAAQGVPSPT